MSEARRVAGGELIYRDFATMYPPLGVLLSGFVYRGFGATFAVTNVLVDCLSVLTVFATWRLALRFLDHRLALGAAAVLACLGGTNGGNFGLFSLVLYTPAILLGAVGLALVLMGSLDLLRCETSLWPKALLVVGMTLALLSKLEHGVAAVATFAVLAVSKLPIGQGTERLRRWARAYASLAAVAFAPSLIVYFGLARVVGTDNLVAGLSGYGIAGKYCPVWPTGLGVLGALGALGAGAAGLAVLTALYSRAWRGPKARLFKCLAVTAAGIGLWALHLPFALQNFKGAQPSLAGARLLIAYCFSMSGLLSPLMWGAVLATASLSVRFVLDIARRNPSPRESAILMVALATSVLASRGLFGHMFGNVSIVHQSAYTLLVPLSAYLLVHAQRLVDRASSVIPSNFRAVAWPELGVAPGRRATLLLVAFGALVTLPRTVGKFLTEPAGARFDTLAGHVYMSDPPSRKAYAYLLEQTKLGDPILESPIGGGLSFAAHRVPATYSMQFFGLLTPDRLMRIDAERVRARPPRLVFGLNNPALGAQYGICGPCACTFPRLVWRSDRLACDPAQHFEVFDFIRANYQVVAHFGSYVALRPAWSGKQMPASPEGS